MECLADANSISSDFPTIESDWRTSIDDNFISWAVYCVYVYLILRQYDEIIVNYFALKKMDVEKK